MARVSDPVDRFARFLTQSEPSPLTIRNYRSDLDAFAAGFEGTRGEPMEPAKITPTDLRQFKRWLVEQRRLKPKAVNRKLGYGNDSRQTVPLSSRSLHNEASWPGPWPPMPAGPTW